MIDDTKCVKCGATSDSVKLEKCVMCYSHYCGDCAFRATGGRRLCSIQCAQILLQGDDDDVENELGPED